MSAGRTTWSARDAAHHDRELVVEMLEEFGPAGPYVEVVLRDLAQQQRDEGRVKTGFRSLGRKTKLTPDDARRIVEYGAEIGLFDDLEIDADGRRFVCRVSGWEADQARGKSAFKKADQRARKAEELDGPDGDEQAQEGDVSPSEVDTSTAGSPTRHNQTREETSSLRSDVGRDVDRIWEAYSATRTSVLGARSVARLTTERRQLIARRLKTWPFDDLADAVRGWRHFPHNRGENDRRQPYCDLELILRDAAHIEKFRDAERHTVAVIDPTAGMSEMERFRLHKQQLEERRQAEQDGEAS